MQIYHALLMLALTLTFPLVANWSVQRFPKLAVLSPVLQCYLFGALLALLPFDLVHKGVAKGCMMVSVPLAIPLLLFSTNFPAWVRLAKRTVLSFLSAMVSTMIMAVIALKLLPVPGEEAWKVAGMIVGVYTGGTPNMSAIGWALEVDESSFILINTVDMILCAALFLVLISVAKPWLSKILPPFPRTDASDEGAASAETSPISSQPSWTRGTGIALGLALLIVVLSALVAVGVTFLLKSTATLDTVFDEPIFNSLIMIAISTFALGASFVPRIRGLEGSFELGDYFILVFCIAIGSQVDVSSLAAAGIPYFIYVGFVILGALTLHIILAMVLRIDVETTIITSTAALYGPAFIGPVAGALKNRELLVSGITSAMVGIALGTQLGLALAYAVQP